MLWCQAPEGDDFDKTEASCELQEVEKLNIPFHGVDYANWDPEVHKTYLKPEGKQNLAKIAKALQGSKDTKIKINGFCGPPIGPKMIALATMRTQVVQEFLKERGCSNQVSVNPLGFELNDKKGPRCEIELCQTEESVPIFPVIQKEVEEEVVPVAPPIEEEVAPPVEEEPAKPYLSVTFSPKGSTETGHVTKTWFDRPLGFTYENEATPVIVTKVVKGSRAHIFGVTEGMEVQAVEFTGQSKVDCAKGNFKEVNSLLTAGTRILPHESDRPYLTLHFQFPASPDEPEAKTWYTKPLGLTWTTGSAPIQINQVTEGSRAWELGTEKGMTIRAVEFTGQAVVDVTSKTYDEAYNLVVKGMEGLADAA